MKSDLNQSVFKSPKWEVKPKLHRYPTKRWGHTAVINKNKLYIYGGKTGRQKEPIYELDCDTLESTILDVTGFPDSRQSHSCSLIKDKLIIWGGCRQEKVDKFFEPISMKWSLSIFRNNALNDCISIIVKDKDCIWSLIPQFPTLKERESHATTVLKDKYIFLYGGSNEDEIYEDCWVFNTELQIWFQIKNVVRKFKKRLGCTLTTINNKIYMFGGETEDESYENELYVLSFSQFQFSNQDKIPEMQCELITPKNNIYPPKRSCHSAVAYQDKYLLIMAGQGVGTDPKGKKSALLLNDVWAFDIQKSIWQMVQITNKNVFKPRSCFTANVFRNKIYVFGGLISTQNFKSSDQLLVLAFSQTTQKPLDICNICKLHYQKFVEKRIEKLPVAIPSKNSFEFGLSNLYKISRMIKNPFDAVCLIVEAYNKMKYSSLAFDLIEGKIIMIQGEGVEIPEQSFLQILNKYEFVQEISSQDPLILSAFEQRKERENLQIFNYNLKNACSRLGQCFVMINRRGVLIDIMLVTPQNIFYCEYNTTDESVGTHQQKSYQIIKNYIHRNNINISLIENATFTVIITDLQRISSTQSQIRVNGKNFVELAGTSKRIGLHNYCEEMFLKKPNIKVSINSRAIQFKDLQNELKDCTYNTQIENDFKVLKLRQVDKEESISIYRGGIRVGKFTKPNPPYIEGYIEISLHCELSLLRHKAENTKFIESQIKNICQQFDECSKKRKNHIPAHELQSQTRNL